ncbi:MAG: carboxymuconolactone decarboxylase family protein [Bacteroidales bacterium]|nr:carboxymuconolactone decarboxylase family protein [Bacteroidales bacterium]
MKSRMKIKEVEPRIDRVMDIADAQIGSFDLNPNLLELIRLRVSQMNGCGYCIDYHTQNALKLGERAQRLFAVSAWWETPFFNEEEQVALKLAEEVTNIALRGLSDEVYFDALRVFGEQKVAQLLLVIATINTWNRLAICTHMVAGLE